MELIDAIISRDECSRSDAEAMITEMKIRVRDGENPEEVLYDEGFELDYFLDIVP